MSNAGDSFADAASIVLDPKRVQIDPRKLKFYRSRLEPTDPEELKARNERRLALADSWLAGPIHDIVVRDGDFAIADGNERVAGILLRGVTEITVVLLPPDTPDSRLDEISLVTEFHRSSLRPYERAMVAKRLLDSTGATRGEIAARLRINPGYLTKHLSVFDCPEEVVVMAEAGRIGPNEWYACSKADDPLKLLRTLLNGGGRKAIERLASESKEKRSPTDAHSQKTDLLKFPFGGAMISIRGADLTLISVARLLANAGREAEAGVKDGQGIKTFASLMVDRQKKAEDEAKKKAQGDASSGLTS